MGIFSRLFGRKRNKPNEFDNEEEYYGVKSKFNNDEYFSSLGQIQDWQSKKEYSKMLKACEKSLPLLSKFVDNTKKEFGSFDISSIPAIEVGCRYWAAMNNIDALNKVLKIVQSVPELEDGWLNLVKASFDDKALSKKIQDHIRENPGCLQNKMGKVLGVSGRDTSRIIGTLNNLEIIKKSRSGKTYQLFLKKQ